MFYKSRSNSTNTSRRSSSYSNIGRSAVDVPALVTTRPSTDMDREPSYQTKSRSSSIGDASKQRSQSTPGAINRTQNTVMAEPVGRKRHLFWKSSLWHRKKPHDPIRSKVRASSQSVALPHPSVVEEQMRNMPHHDWRGKNRPDKTYDDENLARLYW